MSSLNRDCTAELLSEIPLPLDIRFPLGLFPFANFYPFFSFSLCVQLLVCNFGNRLHFDRCGSMGRSQKGEQGVDE